MNSTNKDEISEIHKSVRIPALPALLRRPRSLKL